MSWELNLPIAIEKALQNCFAHGDTDIFPEPHIFEHWRQFPKQAIDATLSLHKFISSNNDLPKFDCIRSGTDLQVTTKEKNDNKKTPRKSD